MAQPILILALNEADPCEKECGENTPQLWSLALHVWILVVSVAATNKIFFI